MNVGGIQTPPSIKNMPASKKVGKKPYLKLNSYTLETGNKIREPPDHTGYEPTPDIPIAGFGQDIKKNKRANTYHLGEHGDHETCSSPKYRQGG